MKQFKKLRDAIDTIKITSTPPDDNYLVDTLKLVAHVYHQNHKKRFTAGDFGQLTESLITNNSIAYIMSMINILGKSLAYNVYLEEKMAERSSRYRHFCKILIAQIRAKKSKEVKINNNENSDDNIYIDKTTI
ncbi:MAG: hypothetical protein K2Q14_04840 [Gammaproteobacteria bacterium]|nr:hypothetical protein [Gammaproteobacteria bacterium]